ncbi:hypothetical protein ON010_g11765 [Phytophthora cinnamomi]|nr:hypothetical protein ON010_g11765 [Phytophthora cinnamomi]
MGLLHFVLAILVTLVVLTDGIASATSEISATESKGLRHKTLATEDARPVRTLLQGDPTLEERANGGGGGGRGGVRGAKRTQMSARGHIYPSELVKKEYQKFIGWLRRIFRVKNN